MSPVRVLAIVTDAWGAGGGIAQYNRDLIAALATSPPVAHIDVLAYSKARDDEQVPPARVAVCAVRNRLAFAARCLVAARGHDLVFCGHLHLAPLAALAARRASAPLWLQTHGIEAWERPARWRRSACETARLVTAVSRHTRARVQSWLAVEPSHLRVLPNTVDECFQPTTAQVAPAQAPLLLTVGRLHAAERYKGHDRVISILPALRATHPGIRYVVAGDGDDKARLVALAHGLGVADCVEFTGKVAGERLGALYRSADLMVMPSTGEGFGIAFLEAMASGTPALGLAGDGSIDALGDGELGIVASESGLETAVRGALTRVVDRARLGADARARFGRPRFERHVAALVEELVTT
jgi:phosphatidyl-myo-inositol dimannoside synthase